MKTAFDAHCWAEIDLDALVHNFHLIREKASPAAVCAVVKADAYGHGDRMAARTLAEAGAAWFAVSSLAEARHLRRGAGGGGDNPGGLQPGIRPGPVPGGGGRRGDGGGPPENRYRHGPHRLRGLPGL